MNQSHSKKKFHLSFFFFISLLTSLTLSFSSWLEKNNVIQLAGLFYLLLSLSYLFALAILWTSSKLLRHQAKIHFAQILFYIIVALALLTSEGIIPLFITTLALSYSAVSLRYGILFSQLMIRQEPSHLKTSPEWYQELLKKTKPGQKLDFLKTVVVARSLNEVILRFLILVVSSLAFILNFMPYLKKILD